MEDPLNKAAQRFWIPTIQAEVMGLSVGPELPWHT